jgi:type IV pilus biogenesis protein CpaD/CtpE
MNVKRNPLRTFALLVFIAVMLNACATSSVVPGNQATQYEETIRSEQEQNYNILRAYSKCTAISGKQRETWR